MDDDASNAVALETEGMTRYEAILQIATIKASPTEFFRRMESSGPAGRLAREYWRRIHELAAKEVT